MKLLKYYLPATVWIILILIVCTLPGNDIPTNSFFEKVHFDKIVHFGLFGGVVLFLSLGIYQQKRYISPATLIMLVIIAAAYGLAIEFIQKYWAIGRSFDIYDVVADTLGAIAGIWVFKIVRHLFFSGRHK
ncbi:VanZ family protein [Chitinophaga polysaccharea]|uniref:VanZ family protein n=1 Tax=Chitinophaga TaxID=79328 RepID=UPI0014557924|nr:MULTISPECIES: VanZ family protein [Chitinophaga]NLR61518.1 VanZ family protein [Chitinophaga polysaccharea]NLU93887.1 VanZ family protein [Chitinophaga sp. Ak27]